MKPGCPFCGELEATVDEISPGQFSCVCQDCGAIGPASDTQELAVKKWDARVNPERDDLKRELTIAVEACCNQYWIDGHGARVLAKYGIDEHSVKREKAE